MTRKAGLVLVMACGLLGVGLATAALAGGGTKVQGSLKESDGKGKIAMVVQIKRGIPTKIKNIKVTNLPYLCTDGSTGSAGSNVGSAVVTFDAGREVFEFFGSHQAGPNTAYTIDGTVSKDGRKVSGGVQVAFSRETPEGTVICDTYSLGEKVGDFRAKAKKK